MSNNNSVKVDTSKRIDLLATANQSGHQAYQQHQQQQLHQGQKRSVSSKHSNSKEVIHIGSSFNSDVFNDVDNDFFKQHHQQQQQQQQLNQRSSPTQTTRSSTSTSSSKQSRQSNSNNGNGNLKQQPQQQPQQQKYTVFDPTSFGGLDDTSSIQSDNEDEYGFYEIKDLVISTNGCSQYYIPFLQTTEMCSNEARKWLAKRWFLPSDMEEIEWTKQNRYYYPVYVFNLSVTTKFSAYFTVKDESGAKDAKDQQMCVQETLSSVFDEIIVCASSSIDVPLVESLIFKNSYSHRYPYYLPDKSEWKAITTDNKLSEKTLSIDISKNDIWVDKVLVYLEQKQKERCQQYIQKKHNVTKVTLDMGQATIDKESYSIVYLPVSADTFRYGEAHYDTLTSGNIGKTVGRSPKGTGMVGATLYGVFSGVSKVVSDSI
ncbi:hypothetical protein SAMD00019534_032690 [Acytostelium subglobosum LB1]|uniref:hypothetical protein n=1 Tax=Acytostelium subglobosum LB1 TaxID=1410327 RepID=UPI000644835B|nr:hypothetical protein SAMD00019534_032690 [Acytostelium subglobosum LB1]GAM20094.1 hypothetical protein SAMD00019534_032690 [Acytostelium subglobosum LB1]|eukprot:XP_012756856.1 hypothetical protein SAMD00019534_032690 [Acytostelium subglobosum LB1]